MPKKIVAFKCACPCGKMIKTLETQRRHLAGLGPMTIKANHTLQGLRLARKVKGSIPTRGARGLPCPHRKTSISISASLSMSSIRFPANSSSHHISLLDLPEVGDPGPSTYENRARRSSSAAPSSPQSQSPPVNQPDVFESNSYHTTDYSVVMLGGNQPGAAETPSVASHPPCGRAGGSSRC